MNKKLLISLAFLIILLVIVLFISNSLHRDKTVIVGATFDTNVNSSSGSSTKPINSTATSSPSLVCQNGLIPVSLVGVGGSTKTFCAPPSKGEYPIGTGEETYSLTGYYSTYDKTMYTFDYDPTRDPLPATTTCSAITVTGGDVNFIQAYKNMIIGGNSVNRLDANGNLVLNINLTDLTGAQKNLLLKLGSQRPLSLSVKARELAGRDAMYCESFVHIVSVE
jgi:hypothetical protein